MDVHTTLPAYRIERRNTFGGLLRDWRTRRQYTQLALAHATGSSARHLSFLETGRAAPSREMVHRLAEQLEIPLRERNALLVAAGFAPRYEPAHANATSLRQAMDTVIAAFEPFPALAVDRHFTLVSANRAVERLLGNVAQHLREPPMNALRLSLHPDGLAPRIRNLPQWRQVVLSRLSRDARHSADPVLAQLLDELRAYPHPGGETWPPDGEVLESQRIAVPLELDTDEGTLCLLSTTTVFGSAVDATLSELAIESFLPWDDATRQLLLNLARRE